MESNYPESWQRHTPKGMTIINTVNKSKKCCDSCSCNEDQEGFNKLMETQTSFEE